MGGLKTPRTDTAQVAVTMVFALSFGILAVAVGLWDNGTVWRGLLWAGAWSSIGWFLGFLFGIPRYLSSDTARTPTAHGLEAAKQDLAAKLATAKAARDAANSAAAAKNAADKAVTERAQAADQAENGSDEAAPKSAAEPAIAALADDARKKAEVALAARQAAAVAQTSATDASATAQQADADAAQAEAAAETAHRQLTSASPAATGSPGSSLTVNTNLEQISDWLTKIIVGVSLVEWQSLLDKMHKAASFMASSMAKADDLLALAYVPSAASTAASAPASSASAIPLALAKSLANVGSAESFAYAVMLYFLATGLLGSYLLTRLFLQRALDNAAQPGTGSTTTP